MAGPKKGDIAKHRENGKLYQVEHVVHDDRGVYDEDVFACYALSGYDGMPIGPQVWVERSKLDFGVQR